MRSVSGDGEAVLPWQVIREDGDGNRYRVGSYATRTEAQQVAERLGGGAGHTRSGRNGREDDGDADRPANGHGNGRGPGSYLVESLDRASGEYA